EALPQGVKDDMNFAEAIRGQRLRAGTTFVNHGGGRTSEHPDRPRQGQRIEAYAKIDVIAAAEGNVYIMRRHKLAGRDAKPDGISVPLALPERPRQDDD